MLSQRATLLMLRHPTAYTYTEGYAVRSHAPLPVLHAWCVDVQSEVIDPTWAKKVTHCLGVPLRAEYVRRLIFERECHGVLDAPELRWRFMHGIHEYQDGEVIIHEEAKPRSDDKGSFCY